MGNWWQRFVWLLKINSVRKFTTRKDKTDELNRSWYRQFMTTRNLHSKNRQNNSDNVYENWYHHFSRILKLQNPNHLYQEKLQNDVNKNWWQRFVWLLKINSVRNLRQEKIKQMNFIE